MKLLSIEKVRESTYYKHRDDLESNRKGLEVDMKVVEDPFERVSLMTKSQRDLEFP